MAELDWQARLDELRGGFDRSFTLPPAEQVETMESLLAVRAGTEALALRLAEVQGLEKLEKVIRLPGTAPELLGLAGLRGRLVAVYSLGRLLGTGGTEDETWCVVCGGEDPVALAFSHFEGQRQVPRPEIVPVQVRVGVRPHVTQVWQAASGARGVLSVPSLLDAVDKRAGPTRPAEE